MSSCSAWRWVTRAMGPPSATAALSALTLFSRPTCSGTIISGKITVSRRATSGSSRTAADVILEASSDRDGRFGIRFLLSMMVNDGWRAIRREVVGTIRWCLCGARFRFCLGGGFGRLAVAHAFVIERFENSLAETLFEFEQDLDAGEVHPAIAGQVPNPLDPANVFIAV